ncbi:ribokinase [Cohaesibacter sp. ES.047]|uniref:ribokinase n=1 Tax=Cohaesibacter sp. ES.047 TaxID=1798205 RepID=UPI000BB90A25|nr:ribokinase [Cohaesibacter sp. ES.047]SNY90242.1 ribokinase [Cohaesibacter sp. ES.047]
MSIIILGSYLRALVMTTERIPVVGETLLGRDFRQTFGGKGSDMAVQAARLGADVKFLGVIGTDMFGDEFVELMKQEGIGIEGLHQTSKLATGAGFIIKDEAAKNVIVIDMGANSLFGKDDITAHEGLIASGKIALAQLEVPIETALFGLQKAKDAGLTTILNPAPAQDLRGVDLGCVDILTPNETEARVALGLDPSDPLSHEDVARQLMETGVGAVVMTLGEDGVAGFTSEGSFTIPPYKVEVVDSNGAGDCFNASLAVGLSEGMAMEDAATFASRVAALCCTRWETVPSYHTRQEVEAILAQ